MYTVHCSTLYNVQCPKCNAIYTVKAMYNNVQFMIPGHCLPYFVQCTFVCFTLYNMYILHCTMQKFLCTVPTITILYMVSIVKNVKHCNNNVQQCKFLYDIISSLNPSHLIFTSLTSYLLISQRCILYSNLSLAEPFLFNNSCHISAVNYFD